MPAARTPGSLAFAPSPCWARRPVSPAGCGPSAPRRSRGVLLAAAAALVVAAYAAASRTDIDATTEVSALVVLAAGVTAGLGQLRFSSAIIAVTTLVLIEKSALHRFAARLDDEGLRAAVRFAVMAAVVLPLLPVGPYGPLDTVRPRELWLLVLFFSALSFAGYLARRAVGPRHGYSVAGLLGGLISSTSVTFTFARLSRTNAGARRLTRHRRRRRVHGPLPARRRRHAGA